MADLLARLLAENPECFPGEDLSLAYSLEDRLRSHFSRTIPSGPEVAQEKPTMPFIPSDEDVRIAARAEECGRLMGLTSADLRPEAPAAAFPIVPVAVGAGALAAVLLVAALA